MVIVEKRGCGGNKLLGLQGQARVPRGGLVDHQKIARSGALVDEAAVPTGVGARRSVRVWLQTPGVDVRVSTPHVDAADSESYSDSPTNGCPLSDYA